MKDILLNRYQPFPTQKGYYFFLVYFAPFISGILRASLFKKGSSALFTTAFAYRFGCNDQALFSQRRLGQFIVGYSSI